MATIAPSAGPKIPLKDRWTILMGHPVKVKATPAYLANEIISHNMTNEYTHCLAIGTSGSGKSTLLQLMLHELHSRHPYQIHFFYKKDVLRLASIIKSLTKRIDHIMIFDDVSYLFKSMKPEQVEELMHQLTVIRHDVQARVVSIFIIHYSYAILKSLRQADFRLVTSMTDEEKENFVKVFGPNNRVLITKFADDYRFETLHKKFYLPGPDGRQREYHTKEPFKIALISAMGKLRYMLFYKMQEPCVKCSPTGKKNLKTTDVNFMDTLIQRYGPNRVKRMADLLAFVNSGESGLGSTDQIVYNQLQKFTNEYKLDLKRLHGILADAKHAPKEERQEHILNGLKHMAEKAIEKKETQQLAADALETDVDDPDAHTDEANEYATDDDIEEAHAEMAAETTSPAEVEETQSEEEKEEEDDDDDDDDDDFMPPPPTGKDAPPGGDDDDMFSGVNFKFSDFQ